MAPRSRSCRSPRPLKRVEGDRVAATVDRSGLAAAQTPQGDPRAASFERRSRGTAAGPATWTDEAALLEACTIPVHVVPGDPGNLKVTVPADLARAADALGGAGAAARTGIGQDSHPFGPGEPLRLGGIDFPGVPRLPGHSDGDVALHALADALLGRRRPRRPRTALPGGAPRRRAGIASRTLLAEVRRASREAGWRPAARGPDDRRRPAAARRRSSTRCATRSRDCSGSRRDAVNVKASSGNLDGSEGAGRAISALAAGTHRGPRVSGPAARHADRRDAAARLRCATTASASTRAARPSTAPRTSAISARSCSPTCSSATCGGAGTPSAG